MERDRPLVLYGERATNGRHNVYRPALIFRGIVAALTVIFVDYNPA
jgi:hypothetical protein